MTIYLDASFLVSALTSDGLTPRAHAFLSTVQDLVLVSDWTTAEFCSALAGKVRERTLHDRKAAAAFEDMDVWVARLTTRVPVTAKDVEIAETMIRGLDVNLRTPDALHVAIALRLGAKLATFDRTMAEAARMHGVLIAAV